MKKATRQQTKKHNTQLILKTIYDRGEISRADIARLTHLTRTTVSDMVAELLKEGLVAETGQGPSAGGKPPILVSVTDDSRHIIGIDLASDKLRGAIINLRGEVKHRLRLSTETLDGAAALERVYDLIDGLIAMADKPILGIGIGSPGLMDAHHGVVINSVNMAWHNLALRKLLTARYDLSVYIANDCQIAALGEFAFGDTKNLSSLIFIKIGRGIGAGIILNRQLYYGDGSYGAGEIGHVMVVENGEHCPCGHYGCLETIVSNHAIVKQAQALAQKVPSSHLNTSRATLSEITIDDIRQALEQGDAAAKKVVDRAGFFLGKALANLVGVLGIRHIVIGGSVSKLGRHLIAPAQRQLNQSTLAALANETEISISGLGQDIVILGAAALVLSRELGI